MDERVVPTSRLLAGACAVVLALSTGCRAGDSGAAPTTRSSGAASSSASPTPSSDIVGRWEREQSCDELVSAMRSAHLDAALPAVLPDFFPASTPAELARKKEPCKGATARPHSHFFTDDGRFGSIDETGKQVDDGPYEAVDDHTLRIGESTFTYRITDNDTLALEPVIAKADRRQALAHPLDWNTAGWQVAVAYGGLPWRRVDCESWC